ncbi:TetR/AcrR family transcriptional regulator [Mycobacteroides salmoniphilum]|uniref:TetR/AcrR family transcriptional regulator n=1 Tax=Mycobacteroides salmoniphilum TaxID=404941 RepID=UPI001F1A6BAC|nr:TetR/AcrR family transcriptional regulator [Mycobacteroides salmoniphilum]
MGAAGSKGVPRAQREQQILDAAADEFGRYGYAGAALSAIASAAGVSKQLVLSYFGSKDGLYVACVERAGRNLIVPIEQAISGERGPIGTADDTLAAIFTALEPRPHDWNVINDRTPPTGGRAHAAARGVRTAIAGQAARGIAGLSELDYLKPEDVSLLTDVWMSTVTALVRWWLRHPEQPAAEMIQRSRRIFAALNMIDNEK